jgi:hypothetical protein
MGVEGARDETRLGGENFHGDVYHVQKRIMRVSWWD